MSNINELLTVITRLRDEIFSPLSSKCDEDSAFPVASLDAIKESNLLGLLVPSCFGGQGLCYSQYEQCLSAIAQGCAATAAAFNMHCIVVGSIAELYYQLASLDGSEVFHDQFGRFFSDIIQDKIIFAAATTEIGSGARFSKVKTMHNRQDDQIILNGKKSFVTMANYADKFLVLSRDASTEQTALSYFLVPNHLEGIDITNDWQTMGMRATDSCSITFNNACLDKQCMFLGTQGMALQHVISKPHWIIGGYLGVYHGILNAIVDFCQEYISDRTTQETNSGLGYQALVQAHLGELVAMVYACDASLNKACALIDEQPGSEQANRAIYASKYLIGEYLPKVALLAMRTCGGNTIRKHFKLEQLLRDGLCLRLMPAVSDVCELFLGRQLLNIPIDDLW